MKPTKQGQVCKIINPFPDENPAETYLITEDLSEYNDDAIIYVVSLTDLQRNVANPSLAPRKAVTKSELTVVAEDLTSYVESWNQPKERLTPKQYLKLHPDKYIMVTYEFGAPIFIAPLKDLHIQVTTKRNEAEIWSELDTTPTKLEYHKISTGYKDLKFEKV